MHWFIFSFLTALFESLKDVFSKKSLKNIDEYIVSLALRFFALPFLLPLLFFIEVPSLGNKLFRVPWKTQTGENIGDRVYYGFTLEELENLFADAGLKLEEQYFLRHSEKVDVKKGMNIVSVLSK